MNPLISITKSSCFLIIVFFLACKLPKHDSKPVLELVWSDEFNTPGSPDMSKWSYDYGGGGWGNQELQYYTDRCSDNAIVENGNLVIEARKEPADDNMNYTSARLVTRGKLSWKYARIEVRAKLPSGVGTWPAIWMLADTRPLKWPDDGEIDIMEHVGFNPGYIHASIHTKDYNHLIGTQKTDTMYVPDYSTAFHVYAVEWDANSLRAMIDGKEYLRFANEHTGYGAWPFDNKMYLLLNIAIGGGWGGQKGVDDKIFPQRMEIDYVRVYQ